MDRGYHVQFKVSDAKQNGYFNNNQGPFGTFQLEVDVRHISGESNLTAAGIVFRLDDWDNYYGFRISPTGTYSIWKEVGGSWTDLVGWTSSAAIREDIATNHLTVLADGSSLVFLINGEEVDEVVDTSFSTGFIGIYARTYDGSTNVHVAFDDIVVTELK
ncbi:family 16 glycoside hydrolase [Candidatus Bipolaricaulota bacterium]